jgi:hypothetical protein
MLKFLILSSSSVNIAHRHLVTMLFSSAGALVFCFPAFASRTLYVLFALSFYQCCTYTMVHHMVGSSSRENGRIFLLRFYAMVTEN